VEVYVSRRDVKQGAVVRLMELVNVEITAVGKDVAYGRVHSLDVEEARRIGAPIVQWVLEPVEVRVVKPVAVGRKEEEVGLGERALEKVEVGSYVQFMRYGFVKKISPLVFVYFHD
jgi:glutamyl-tRNA synthetase